MHGARPSFSVAVALAVVTLASARVQAQTAAETEATWRSLVAEAQSAQSTGDHARALDLAQRAVRTHATPSLQRFVAGEQSALGQVAAALASAQRCVDGATANLNLPERASTLAECTTLARQLSTRVGRLVIQAPDPPPEGLQVTVAGTSLPAALLGVPYVITPGQITVVATAPGRQTFRRELRVDAGASVPLSVTLSPATETARPTDGTVHPVEPAGPPGNVPVDTRTSVLPTVALASAIGAGAALAVGIVAIVVGTGAAGSFDSNPACTQYQGVTYGGDACQSALGTANTMRALAIGSFVGTGLLAGTAAVLWLTAPSRHDTRSHAAAFGCGRGPGTLGITCGAAF